MAERRTLMKRGARRTILGYVPIVVGAMVLGGGAGRATALERAVQAAPVRDITQPPEPTNPGKALELWVDRPSGVTSVWLSNGVLLHHKYLKSAPAAGEEEANGGGEKKSPTVAVCITLAGSELLESPENRGVSDAAVAAAWNTKSVRSMKAGELDIFLDNCGANIRCFGGADSFMLTITCSVEKLEATLRGVRLLLSEPVVDPTELGLWKERTVQQMQEREESGSAFDGVVSALFGPQEARARRPLAENIKILTAEQAQNWLDAAVGGPDHPMAMPMEVSIAGDVPVDRAVRAGEVYLASLPKRERISETTFAERRVATRAQRPPEVYRATNWKSTPLVLVGFFGADIRDIHDHRALATAAKILSNRLTRLPPEQNDGEQAFAMAMPASVYPGFGLFLATTHAREGSEQAASENIHKLLHDVIANGPTPEELSTARNELGSTAAKMLGDPVYWARTLSRSVYHGIRLPEISAAERTYREMQPGVIVETLKKYCTPEQSIRLVVKPGEAGGE